MEGSSPNQLVPLAQDFNKSVHDAELLQDNQSEEGVLIYDWLVNLPHSPHVLFILVPLQRGFALKDSSQ